MLHNSLIALLTMLLITSVTQISAQSLPIDFEGTITTDNFIDFNGGTATVIDNPQTTGINTSDQVAQIVRDGGDIWAGSKIDLAENLDFTTMNAITMKVFTTAPIGTTIKFKLEGAGETERDVFTTVSNAWEELTWDFTGEPRNFNSLVFMFDFGNVGDGSETSTFLFDDVQQLFGGNQLDLPVDFEGVGINYTVTDFGGNRSTLTVDPTDPTNQVIEVIKMDQAATWAGTTIGTPGGFATNIPLTLTDSKMRVRVWSPDAGIPIRLKVEDSKDPTHTCETETRTTVAGEWEDLEFDFINEAPGTAQLSTGLNMGWTYNMASIFFNFGTEGSAVGEKTYYFDDVIFGQRTTGTTQPELKGIEVLSNPTVDFWTIRTKDEPITSVEIYSLDGQLVSTMKPHSAIIKLDARHLLGGTYIAVIKSDNGSKALQLVKL